MAFFHAVLALLSSLEEPFLVMGWPFLESLMLRSTSLGAKINEFLDNLGI